MPQSLGIAYAGVRPLLLGSDPVGISHLSLQKIQEDSFDYRLPHDRHSAACCLLHRYETTLVGSH
jgi:hypothetical protein